MTSAFAARTRSVGQLYNGVDAPPFAAGVDSGVNHPGVISGLHSQALDGAGNSAGYNQWVVDDATGQLRMRLAASYTAAQVGLGHLIEQAPSSAQRGGLARCGIRPVKGRRSLFGPSMCRPMASTPGRSMGSRL